jgi:uncharacterized protein YndB with AHSA1/START domain
MVLMDVEVNVRERVLKPVGEVFEAVIDPAKMSNYFISSASAPMTSGTRVQWEFADVDAKVAVDIVNVERDRKIVFDWNPADGKGTRTTIRFTPDGAGATVVTINEARFPFDEEGVKRAMGQTGGWTYFLACLKAYVQHGINLRIGLNKRITDI